MGDWFDFLYPVRDLLVRRTVLACRIATAPFARNTVATRHAKMKPTDSFERFLQPGRRKRANAASTHQPGSLHRIDHGDEPTPS